MRTMRLIFLFLFFASDLFLNAQNNAPANFQPSAVRPNWVLVIHGGAGGPPKGSMSIEKEKQYTDSLNMALAVGAAILERGGSSLDAVEAVIRFMEDCPLFNAGKGAVLTSEGIAELDASIMDGKSGLAGAVAGVTTIKNPVTAARRVMDKTSHVMLIGQGAEHFARSQGLDIVEPSYFITPSRYADWKKARDGRNRVKPEKPSTDSLKGRSGTVGAVALDTHGNLAAATSTGGMMMKMPGRVGDSPIIGAGTWADNKTCAVSCTGHGEFFIRNLAAYSVAVQMEYKKMGVEDAANYVIFDRLRPAGGEGGLIALDRQGNIAMPFSTNAMFRGTVSSGSRAEVWIY